LDFVSDGVASGRAIRLLCIVDTYTRECLALDVETSFPSPRVTRVLDGLIASRGVPERIRCDNVLNARSFLMMRRSKSADRAVRGLFVNEQSSSTEMPVVST
jgi:putative transposase